MKVMAASGTDALSNLSDLVKQLVNAPKLEKFLGYQYEFDAAKKADKLVKEEVHNILKMI